MSELMVDRRSNNVIDMCILFIVKRMGKVSVFGSDVNGIPIIILSYDK